LSYAPFSRWRPSRPLFLQRLGLEHRSSVVTHTDAFVGTEQLLSMRVLLGIAESLYIRPLGADASTTQHARASKCFL
jgi:hypothetical protein